jgi:hypothetical protein
MNHTWRTQLVVAGLAAAMLEACGGNNNGPNSETDASFNDAVVPGADALTPDGEGPGPDGGGGMPPDAGDASFADAGDGGCNFATFVIGLVTTDTTMTALPSTSLGQGCTDDQNQADFQPLFP